MTEIKLSKRMEAVASMVNESSVADIGCDHAFVSMYLIKAGIANRVIAMDVKEGPLRIAGENIFMYGLKDKIEVRASDGLHELKPGETECAIIAGMGGELIQNILQAAGPHIARGIHFVLQPQSEPWKVREFLYTAGYTITDEKMLIEDDKYYVVMKAVPSDIQVAPYTKEELYFGRQLLKQKNQVLKAYIQNSIIKKIELKNNLEHIHTEKTNNRIKDLEIEISFMKSVLEVYY